jgi:hypothetical protein
MYSFLNQCKLSTISTDWNSVSSVNICKSCQFLVSWNFVRYEILAAASSNIIMVWDVMPCSSVYTACADDSEESAYKITWHWSQEYYDPQEVMFCQIWVLNLSNKAVTLLFIITSKSNCIERTHTTHSQRVWNLNCLQVQARPNFILPSMDGTMSTYYFIRIFSIISKTDGLILKNFPLYNSKVKKLTNSANSVQLSNKFAPLFLASGTD